MPHSIRLYRRDIAYHRFTFPFVTYYFNIYVTFAFAAPPSTFQQKIIITDASETFAAYLLPCNRGMRKKDEGERRKSSKGGMAKKGKKKKNDQTNDFEPDWKRKSA